MYKKRAHLLYNIYQYRYRRQVLDCYSSIFDLLKDIIPETLYPSVTEHHECLACSIKYTESKNFIDVTLPHFREDGFSQLQTAVINSLRLNSQQCRTCNTYNRSVSIDVHEYICIDVSYFLAVFNDRPPFSCTLKDIPINLNIQNSNYELVSAVEHQRVHFVSYCRSPINNKWDKRDDMHVLGKRVYQNPGNDFTKKKNKI